MRPPAGFWMAALTASLRERVEALAGGRRRLTGRGAPDGRGAPGGALRRAGSRGREGVRDLGHSDLGQEGDPPRLSGGHADGSGRARGLPVLRQGHAAGQAPRAALGRARRARRHDGARGLLPRAGRDNHAAGLRQRRCVRGRGDDDRFTRAGRLLRPGGKARSHLGRRPDRRGSRTDGRCAGRAGRRRSGGRKLRSLRGCDCPRGRDSGRRRHPDGGHAGLRRGPGPSLSQGGASAPGDPGGRRRGSRLARDARGPGPPGASLSRHPSSSSIATRRRTPRRRSKTSCADEPTGHFPRNRACGP